MRPSPSRGCKGTTAPTVTVLRAPGPALLRVYPRNPPPQPPASLGHPRTLLIYSWFFSSQASSSRFLLRPCKSRWRQKRRNLSKCLNYTQSTLTPCACPRSPSFPETTAESAWRTPLVLYKTLFKYHLCEAWPSPCPPHIQPVYQPFQRHLPPRPHTLQSRDQRVSASPGPDRKHL